MKVSKPFLNASIISFFLFSYLITQNQAKADNGIVSLDNLNFYYQFEACNLRNCTAFLSHFTNYLQRKSSIKLIDSATFSTAVINELGLCGAQGGNCEQNQLSEVEITSQPYELKLKIAQQNNELLAIAELTQSDTEIFTLEASDINKPTRRTFIKLAEQLANKLINRTK